MKERRAVIRETAKRYRRASKKQKGQLLDEVTALTGYHRAYACYLLNREGKKMYLGNRTYLQADVTKKTKRRRRRVYDERVKQALLLLWQMLGYPCGKRLAPVLPELIEALKRHGEWQVDAHTESKLLRISASTIDRLLAPEKRQGLLKPKSHTKPGTLLKKQIPVRTFADWDEKRPGFLEADLVAH
ncbi:MAG: transposase, partial [Chthonomonadetes bacterium]|nr:transposase [Chthonomonadetes bacterium]